MRSPLGRPLVCLKASAALAVLAGGVFFSPAVRAGCGDHEPPRPPASPPSVPSFRSGNVISLQMQPGRVIFEVPTCPCRSSVPAHGLPAPCDGPGCSAPDAPEPATVPFPVPSPEDWAMPDEILRIFSATPARSCVDSRPAHPPVQLAGIFRPPRFASFPFCI
jgi:hypothetical protein